MYADGRRIRDGPAAIKSGSFSPLFTRNHQIWKAVGEHCTRQTLLIILRRVIRAQGVLTSSAGYVFGAGGQRWICAINQYYIFVILIFDKNIWYSAPTNGNIGVPSTRIIHRRDSGFFKMKLPFSRYCILWLWSYDCSTAVWQKIQCKLLENRIFTHAVAFGRFSTVSTIGITVPLVTIQPKIFSWNFFFLSRHIQLKNIHLFFREVEWMRNI